ncbi:hypothetical protein Ciccas_000344 [Cichlidogyrus casuarinus]|uniref:Uncharacterized protein n=1 Tax=Cichlidogyrus casuarinus TaxID=1844966 RepID=A0ABD2QN72_9PLAT
MRLNPDNPEDQVKLQTISNDLNLALREHQGRWSQAIDLHTEGDESCEESDPCADLTSNKTDEHFDFHSSTPDANAPYSISQEFAAIGNGNLRKGKYSSASIRTESGVASLDRARDDVEFYRNQVELLREEADEFQTFANLHYEEKIIILSDRVESLQNQLAHLTHKNERLTRELEESTQTAADAKMCERSLQIVVDQLSKQLTEYRESPRQLGSENGDSFESVHKEKLARLENCLNYVERVREYVAMNMKSMQNTIFAPGAEFDIFSENLGSTTPTPELQIAESSPVKFFARSDSNHPLLSPSVFEASVKKTLDELQNKNKDLQSKLDTEVEDREALDLETMELRNKNASLQRQLKRSREELDEEVANLENTYQRRVRELQEQLDDECKLRELSEQLAKSLEEKIAHLRRACDLNELETVTEAWQETETKLRNDVKYYKRSLELVQEELDHFKAKFDPDSSKKELAEREERIRLLGQEKQQLRVDLDINAIKLQNTTTLLDDTETRLRTSNKERNSLMQRMNQLEAERDDAIREAANATGKAGAVHEASQARTREVTELRNERDCLKRELSDLRAQLTNLQVDSRTEITQLKTKVRDLEKSMKNGQVEFEAESERLKDELEAIQAELKVLQANELALKTSNRQLKRTVEEKDDEHTMNIRKIGDLERLCTDLSAERDRAKADLTASRETASLLRAVNRKRMNEEFTTSDGHLDLNSEADSDLELIAERRNEARSPDRFSNSSLSNARTENLLRIADEMALEASLTRYNMTNFDLRPSSVTSSLQTPNSTVGAGSNLSSRRTTPKPRN